jgi:hypothetical protein
MVVRVGAELARTTLSANLQNNIALRSTVWYIHL